MANLYADENFDYDVVQELRVLGHDILTAQEAGQANQGIRDPLVFVFANQIGRTVITFNRKDYKKLHKKHPVHSGIIICTDDDNILALSQRLHHAILANSPLDNKLIRVNKASRP